MSLIDFYRELYNSDPFALLDAAHSELHSMAGAAGIDWGENANDIQLTSTRGTGEKFSKYARRSPTANDPSLKGRVEIYSRMETARDGLLYPFVNFVRKGHDAGSWSGLSWLVEHWRRHIEISTGTVVPVSEKDIERKLRAAEKQAERERMTHINALIQNQDRHQALMDYFDFRQNFALSPFEDGSFPYAVRKQIGAIFSVCNVRRMSVWDRGPSGEKSSIMAIPLSHLDGSEGGRVVGWQRIRHDGRKFQTAAVDAGEFAGACHVIGNLRNAKRVCVVEGFATGASVYLAAKKRFDAVIVAVSANNLPHVIERIIKTYEGVKVWCALDNDQASAMKGKGNTGLLTGLEILRRFPGVVCTRPLFSATDLENEFSDFNDLHVKHGLQEVGKQLGAVDNRLKPANELDAELMKLEVMNRDRKKYARQLMRCVNVGMKSCPAVLSPRELIDIIKGRVTAMAGDLALMKNVKSQVERVFTEKCLKAQAFRSFSPSITDPALRPDYITYKRFNAAAITPEVLKYIQSLDGPVIVRAGMGSGKSKHLLRPMMHDATRGLSVAHRVSLIGGLWDMMTRDDNDRRMKCDILHYQDPGYAELAPYANKLTICINSIVKGCWQPLMKNHDFFGLDEATQGLRAILSGKAMENPVAVFNQLIDSIARTEDNAVLVDADASDILVDLCKLALSRREKLGLSSWTQIHVVELPVDVSFKPTPEAAPQQRRVLYTDKDRIVVEMLKAVQKGEKFLMATDSTAFAEQMLLQLRERWPEKRWLYVSQDTKPDADVVAFTDAPNQQASLYDGLIYSPAISSAYLSKPATLRVISVCSVGRWSHLMRSRCFVVTVPRLNSSLVWRSCPAIVKRMQRTSSAAFCRR